MLLYLDSHLELSLKKSNIRPMTSKNLIILTTGIIIIAILVYFVLQRNTNPSVPLVQPNVTSVPSVAKENTATTSGETQLKVAIKNFAFDPSVITVKVGTSVTWVNNDTVPHDVVSDIDGAVFTSPLLKTGESFQFTFDKVGSFSYRCGVHPAMAAGTVTVTP